MAEEIDEGEIPGAVLNEIRIVRFIAEDGQELVGVNRIGDASIITVLGMLDLARDTVLREDEQPGDD